LAQAEKPDGFTIVEIVITMFVLAVFLLPLLQHFTHTRRLSLAARDTVIVNSFQTSCLGELCQVDYKELLLGNGATLSKIINKYSGNKTVNKLTISATTVSIQKCPTSEMIVIEIESGIRLPGAPDSVPKRKIGMRNYIFARP
jgi:prepilin-type N-terminal cleavage/methylation domain-containing protein